MKIPLNSTQIKAAVGTVSSDLGSSAQERQCQDSESPAEAHQDAEGTGPAALQGDPKFCLETKGFGETSD